MKVIIIDEISMGSNDLVLHIHLRLIETFTRPNNTPFAGITVIPVGDFLQLLPVRTPFAGITVIPVGDFLQLLPVRTRPVYAEYNNSRQNLDLLWDIFEIAVC